MDIRRVSAVRFAPGHDPHDRRGHRRVRRRGGAGPRLAHLLVLLSAAIPAAGTTLARMGLEQLTARAAAVVRARCAAVEVRTDARGMWTLTTFERVESWKGIVPQRFQVRLPGGAAGGLRETVAGAPQFSAGEDAVLFLEPLRSGGWTIVGWAQGTYRIRRTSRDGAGRAVPDAAGMTLVDPRTRVIGSSGEHEMDLPRFRALVTRLAQGETR